MDDIAALKHSNPNPGVPIEEEQVCYVCGEPVCAACEETEDEEEKT
jgi:hypothetical protein